jgi:shikimate kinase
MKTSIALVGYMGTGKSTVGKVLAKALTMRFVELDRRIERKAGKPISAIFRDSGEPAFRKLETEAVEKVSREKKVVVACGGGVVLNPVNVEMLRRESVIVLLTAPVEAILERTAVPQNKRPLLESDDREMTVRQMLAIRKSAYENAADITVDTGGLSIDEVSALIIKNLKEHESFSFSK